MTLFGGTDRVTKRGQLYNGLSCTLGEPRAAKNSVVISLSQLGERSLRSNKKTIDYVIKLLIVSQNLKKRK